MTITCNFFLSVCLSTRTLCRKQISILFYQDGQVIVKMRIGRPLSKRFMESDCHGYDMTWFIVYPRQTPRTIISVPLHLNEFYKKRHVNQPNRIMFFVCRVAKDNVSKILTLKLTQECFQENRFLPDFSLRGH